ncbi:MAG: PEP-CTERM sorting domain-containing protein [Gemmatimonadales bacterium]|nr:PEP-CTERM sorting domain-containing protein [Gemmatimonadales bacterium]
MRPFLTVAVSAMLVASAPAAANAQAPSSPTIDCTMGVGAFQLGFGGYFSNCWAGFEVSRYFENATHVSNMYWFNGMPTTNMGGTNEPTSASGTLLFNNDCGSNGDPALPGAFCNPMQTTVFEWGNSGELVFGLNKFANGDWWLYTGDEASRNTPAPPAGIQNYLWYIIGGTYDGQFLLGWEDLNSGCLDADSSTGDNTVSDPGTVNGDNLDRLLAACNTIYSPSSIEPSDDDYNDFYAIINPLTASDLGEITEVVPEPMTMSLLATGLMGLGGASLRRKRQQK